MNEFALLASVRTVTMFINAIIEQIKNLRYELIISLQSRF
jgi:hypothetical protein